MWCMRHVLLPLLLFNHHMRSCMLSTLQLDATFSTAGSALVSVYTHAERMAPSQVCQQITRLFISVVQPAMHAPQQSHICVVLSCILMQLVPAQ